MNKTLVTVLLLVALLGCSAPGGDNMPGLSPIAVEIGTGGALDFGTLPRVSLQKNRAQTWAAWIYVNAISPTAYQVIMSTNAAGRQGRYLFVSASAGLNRYIGFGAETWTTNEGSWDIAANQFNTGEWVHVAVSYDSSATSKDPVFYINGALKATVDNETPAGTFRADNDSLMVGNWSLLNSRLNGKIFDPRIYTRILTAAEVATLYNSGTPSHSAGYVRGSALYNQSLVFDGFAVRTEKLADYVDQDLTGLKVFEAQYLAVGGVIGTVTGRSAP